MATPELNITVACSSEYPDYAYNAKHDIWALVTLKAPCQEEDEEDQRAPIDVVAVLDKSGSMAGEKLKLVKKTMEFVLTQLTEKDRLALITYDTDVYVTFGLMKMTKENKESALTKIKNISDGSSTNLCGGLMKGLVQIIDRPPENKNEVASVLMFTDGLANQGISTASGIVAAMKDPKRFDGPGGGNMEPSPHNYRGGPPPPPSGPKPQAKKGKKMMKKAGPPPPPEEDTPPPPPERESSESKAADASVYTFGFGTDHNEEMMKAISDAGNGMYYFIETEDKIGESFAHCLGGLMSTVAQGIQLQVTMEPGVAIKEVHSARPYEQGTTNADGIEQFVKVNIGDLQSEEGRDIVLELTIDAVNEPYEQIPQPMFKANVDYFNVVTNNIENAVGCLGVLRPANEGSHDEATVNPVVTKERCRVGMTKAMKEADEKASRGDYEGAKMLLGNEIGAMKKKRGFMAKFKQDNMAEELDAMTADMEECQVNAANSAVWNQKGKKMQMNKMQQYECQRSSNAQAKAFRSKKKGACVGKSKAFFQEEEEEE